MPKFIGGIGDAVGTSVPWMEVDRVSGETFPDVCPGWAGRQPLVMEACAAYAAFDKGAFGDCFPNPSNVLVEAVFELKRGYDDFSRQLMAAVKEKTDV